MDIGDKIRELRLNQKMTLDELSLKSGVSKGLLSIVERGKSFPTVKSLEYITKALGTTIARVYAEIDALKSKDNESSQVTVVHKNERKRLILSTERGEAFYELLSPNYQKKLQIVYVQFPVGEGRGKSMTHEGEECGIILEGRLKAYIGNQTFILEEGDTIIFDSSLPHFWENIGDIAVRAFLINTPPTF